jgi:hypothetical protein
MTRFARFVRAYTDLIAYDLFLARHDFASLHRRIGAIPLRRVVPDLNTTEAIATALDVACCFYPKRVMCLQRSATLVRMLRRNGIPASMVIGAQKLPFKAHAWVEVDGQILNDNLASQEKFLILEVC